MILSFLYHRVGDGKYANPPDMLQQQFAHFSKHYPNVLPGEKIRPFSLNICLTFDDATYDFYHYAYPLLKQFNLRAVLAVPTKFILDDTPIDAKTRLSIPYSSNMKGDLYRTHAPFCTWKELKEMAQSGHVSIASHSSSHLNLLTEGLDLSHEIVGSKTLLEQKLNVPINTFVYPLGKFDRAIHQLVKKHYLYAMRIGTAWNWSWQNTNEMIYRIISDNLRDPKEHLRLKRFISFTWFYLLNTLRGR